MFDKNINPAFIRVARVLQYDYVAKPMKPLGAGEIIKERGRVKRTDFTELCYSRGNCILFAITFPGSEKRFSGENM